MQRFRAYRETTAVDGAAPVSFGEWVLGRIAGHLLVATAKKARKRGDTIALNHALLALWAGDTSDGGHPAGRLAPAELSRARKEGRLRLVVDPESAPSTSPTP
jgi:hypothetical protein